MYVYVHRHNCLYLHQVQTCTLDEVRAVGTGVTGDYEPAYIGNTRTVNAL